MSRPFRFVRKYVKVFLWALAILIIPSFILWGVGSAVRDQSRSRFAGTIFKHKVSWNEFDQAYKTTRMLLVLSDLEQYLAFLNPEELAWERLILLQEAQKRKIRVSDQDVVAYIQKVPGFRDRDGFDQRRYEDTVRLRFQLDPRTFEEEVRKTLAITKLRDQVMAEVILDEEALWKEYRAEHDKRRISLVEFETEDYEKEVSLAEREAASYFEANAKTFERSERIQLQTAGLAFKESGREEVKRRLDQASDALGDPAAFETVAKDHGLTLQTTELFSPFEPPKDFPNELLAEAARLGLGKVSDPIETASGIYLVKLLEKKPPQVPSFEEARPEVEKVLKRQKAEALCQERAIKALQEIQAKMKNESLSFEEAAKVLGLSTQESPPFSRRETIEGIGMTPELNRAAFALSLKEVGGVVRIQKGFAILQPKEEIPVPREPFEKEKEAFRKMVTQKKQLQHFNEWFQVLRAKAQLVSNTASPLGRSEGNQ